MLKIYNTLTKKKEEFKPIAEGKIGMYACGTTPYKPAHLGHAMQGVVFDVVRRYLEYRGFEVTYVRNYTDIDDKIIDAAKELKRDPLEHSKAIIAQTDEEFVRLGVREPDVAPKVSDHVVDITAMVLKLIEAGYAYDTEKGNVYFRVKKFKDYGKLSRQKLDELQEGVRKDNEPDKEDVLDFALWKSSGVDEISWDSPWGPGRPGWHIECSVMSSKYLGEHFDIHGGGADLIFPHHENEIAQSESLHGHFANVWMHNGLFFLNNEKMSKSVGNVIGITERLKRYHSETIRYLILSNHYRSRADFIQPRYREVNKNVYDTYKVLAKLDDMKIPARDNSMAKELVAKFEEAMDDDFNTVPVFVQVLESVTRVNEELAKDIPNAEMIGAHRRFIDVVASVLGVFGRDPRQTMREMEDLHLGRYMVTREYVEGQVKKRSAFRAEKDYLEADRIAEQLADQGVVLQDGGEQTNWEPKY